MASSRLILLRRLITSARSAPSARLIYSPAPLQHLFKTHQQQISCLSDKVFARNYATDRRPTKMPKRAVSESDDDEDFDEDEIDTEDLDSEDLGSDDLTEDLDSEDFTEGDDDEDDDEDFYSEEASEEEEDTKKKSKKK